MKRDMLFRPVSAYALFFRDKQATIKGTKPDASFGEVSKIVAHMWDNLEPEKKSVSRISKARVSSEIAVEHPQRFMENGLLQAGRNSFY